MGEGLGGGAHTSAEELNSTHLPSASACHLKTVSPISTLVSPSIRCTFSSPSFSPARFSTPEYLRIAAAALWVVDEDDEVDVVAS